MHKLEILNINEKAGKIPGCIRFDKGSSKFPFPKSFLPLIEETRKEITGEYFYYPTIGGEENLKREIIKIEKQYQRNIQTKNITITHGGMSGLFTVFAEITKSGDEVITNTFSFEGFTSILEHYNLIQKRVNFADELAIQKAITKKTKAIIFNSPENPSGKVSTKKEVDALVKIAQQNKIFLVSDEVMRAATYEGNTWYGPSINSPYVITINSFAKNWFIPGIRVGWIATKNKKLSEQFNNNITLQSIGVNLFGQKLVTKILRNAKAKKELKENTKVLAEKKKFTEKLLQKNNIEYIHDVEGGMNFYINLKKDSKKMSELLLKKEKVAVIPGYLFEGKKTTYARMGFGAVSKEDIKKGIKKIAKHI